MKISSRYLTLALAFLLFGCNAPPADGIMVNNPDDFQEAVSNSKPGDRIVLANGNWNDAELLFEAEGTKENPITLTVQEKGKVFFEGNSNLRIAGNHLVVEGLVFRNGFTPTNEVISFRKDKNTLANNSRLTECVIDDFSNPERHEPDTWVAIYGKNNRIDHNHLENKRNRGVTMTVRLNTEESRQNHHRIDHNYFGPRQNLGSNGGETLRIGTSHFSLTNSNTLVEANFFDRCNGEHEIISNKSGQNIYKHNVFYECAGTLTMRHGNETMVDGNVFIGNNKPSTGGVRVINGQQTVINNVGIGLKGYRFRGALVIMNGVPNSPINRYFQVEDAKVSNNTFINCDHIQLCAGSDAERSATPINTIVSNNIFYNENQDNLFTVYDDISGIKFEKNLISPNVKSISDSGFFAKEIAFESVGNSILKPMGINGGVGAEVSNQIATKENTGATWYPKVDKDIPLSSGNTILVSPGLNTLFDAAKSSSPGDIIMLESGTYTLTKTIKVSHPLTFTSGDSKKPEILFEKKTVFEIEDGGSLLLSGLHFDGEDAPDRTGNSVISTSKYSMITNYKLFISDCEFTNLDVNRSYDAIMVHKNTFADTISIKNSSFDTLTGHVIALDKETEDIGIYNAEYVIMQNNVFSNIDGAALRLHRGGKDESTFGPFLEMDHCVFDNVGNGTGNKYGKAVSLYGVQVADIKNSIFNASKGIGMHLVVGEPKVNVVNNNFTETETIAITGDQKYTIDNSWAFPIGFDSENEYRLTSDSQLKGKATDGGDIGLKTLR